PAALRMGASPQRAVLGSLPSDLAAAPAQGPGRPAQLDKYYRPFESQGLALGGISSFTLPAFGAAPSFAPGVGVSGSDYASAGLARLSGGEVLTFAQPAPISGGQLAPTP